MTACPIRLRQHTTCTPQVRTVLGRVYEQVRADLLQHPNYRLSAFLERLDRHGPSRDGRLSSPMTRGRERPLGTRTATPSHRGTGGRCA